MSLKQALDFLKQGCVFVMVRGRNCRIFYNKEHKINLESSTFCYLECSDSPGLMDKGEWDFYLLEPRANQELEDCPLAQAIAARRVSKPKEFVLWF